MRFKFVILFSMLFSVFFSERAYCQDKDDDDESPTELNTNDKNMLDQIKTKEEACSKLEEKVVSYLDSVFYVKDCALRRIKEDDVLNALISTQNQRVVYLTAKVYALLPLKKEYGLSDYYTDFKQKVMQDKNKICKQYNNNIVTADNRTFYFFADCHKRKFKEYADVQKFNTTNLPVMAMIPPVLDLFPDGAPMVVELPPAKRKRNLVEEGPHIKSVCTRLESQVVSFHNSFFFLENCRLRPIVQLSLKVQRLADEENGIQELTAEQMLLIEEGKPISKKELLSKME